jgi:hypothetical protein
MSDFGRSGGEGDALSSGDVWRYVWLFALGTLLLCALAATVDDGFVILLAVYLVVAAAVAVGYAVRRRRS